MKKFIFSILGIFLVSGLLFSQNADLLISEYCEGSSNNKYLELYNGTGVAVDLSSYEVWRISNGGDWVEGAGNSVALSGILADGDVFVVANSQAIASMQAAADLVGTSITYFNGDDAVALVKITATDTFMLDAIGEDGADPGSGWNVAGTTNATANHTLVRKHTVTQGNMNWALSAGTDVNDSEWIVYPTDTHDNIGLPSPIPATTTSITFNVNMNYQATNSLFDPVSDIVDVAGNFNGWSGNILDDTDGDLIYSLTVDSLTIGDTLEFKFRINSDWGNAEFPGAGNRTYVLGQTGNEFNCWYNNQILTTSIYDIQFTNDPSGDSPLHGQVVYTQGIVTATYYSGYFIQNSSSAWNGVYVYDNSNSPSVGDDITIEAEVDEYNGVTELKNVSDFIVNSSGNVLPNPMIVNISDFTEMYEGVLIQLDSVICSDDDLGYGEWQIANGADTGVVGDMMHGYSPVLGASYKIAGILHYSYGAFKIEARDSADIQDLAIPVVYYDLTFNVNMNYQITLGNFDPLTDVLDVPGDHNSWSTGDILTDPDSNGIYSITLTGFSENDYIEYKFRINEDWNNAEYPGGGNRDYVILAGANVLDFWYNDEEPPAVVTPIYDIQFTTDPSGDSPYAGQVLTTNGVVVAKTNNSFFLQSAAGAWNGIYVYTDPSAVNIGDNINIEAEVAEYFNLTQLKNVVSITVNSSGNMIPAATSVTCIEVGEAYESVLIQLDSVISIDNANNYGEWHVSDGIDTVMVDDVFYGFTPTIGDAYQVKGCLYYSWGNYKLEPLDSTCVVPVGAAPQTYDVTFNVNMSVQIQNGNFNPAQDTLDVPGTFNAWGTGSILTDTDGDGIYTITLNGFYAGDNLTFKFRINEDWNNAEFPNGGTDRNYTVVAGTNVVDFWYNDVLPPMDVTFTVTDGTESYLDLELKGTFTDWNLVQMFDDGTNGDQVANDYTWTAVIPVSPGSHEWGAIENDGTQWGIWLMANGNLAFTLDTSGMISGDIDYYIQPPGGESVTFNVNMNQQITLGNFDPLVDFVDIGANFNGYAGSGAMDDTDGDGIYTQVIDSLNMGYVCSYKFRINGTGWESLANNRSYEVVAGTNEVTHWFNDEALVVNDLFFSEYIEGSSNNKAIEIYNGTGAAVDLSQYSVQLSRNGSGWGMYDPTTPQPAFIVNLSGMLADGDVYVMAADQAGSDILMHADDSLSYPSPCHFNGDDAVGLFKDTILIDIIGEELVDPGYGWDVAGVSTGTQNHTIVRKWAVETGNTNWTASAGSDPASSEWLVFDQNDFDYIGEHTEIIFDSVAQVTFNVNMVYQMGLGNFIPGNDVVDIAGTMNGWGTNLMLLDDADEDGIYTIVIDSVPVNTQFQFKFRINSDWGTSELSGASDRTYTVIDGINEMEYVYDDNEVIPMSLTIDAIQSMKTSWGGSYYDGYEVSTYGVVTGVTSNSFFLQNGVGVWNGIYIYSYGHSQMVGDNISFDAEVDEYYDLTELKNLSNIVLNGTGNSVGTVVKTIGEVSEELESAKITIENVECISYNSTYGEWEVTDQTDTIVIDDLMYAFTPTIGNSYDITAAVYYSYGEFKLEPFDSTSVVDAAPQIDVQNIELHSGWNMFSTYIEPADLNIASVMSGIETNVIIVKNNAGMVYWPAYSINAIGNISTGEAYVCKMSVVDTLTVEGMAVVPELTNIPLNTGWNLLGYLRQTSGDIVVMLATIQSDIIIVKNENGQVYWPAYSINAIGNMDPGKGYQVKVTSTLTFVYPANSAKFASTINPEQKFNHFNQPIPTGSNYSLCIPIDSWTTLPSKNSEIAVLNNEGTVLGLGKFENENLAIAIWGDDFTTAQIDGFNENEELSLRIWDYNTNSVSNLRVSSWLEGNGTYETDGIGIINKLMNTNQFSVSQNIPNPANNNTQIDFCLSEDSYTSIELFNSQGKRIYLLLSEYLTAGNHSKVISTEQIPAGIYYYKINSNGGQLVKQMTIVH